MTEKPQDKVDRKTEERVAGACQRAAWHAASIKRSIDDGKPRMPPDDIAVTPNMEVMYGAGAQGGYTGDQVSRLVAAGNIYFRAMADLSEASTAPDPNQWPS